MRSRVVALFGRTTERAPPFNRAGASKRALTGADRESSFPFGRIWASLRSKGRSRIGPSRVSGGADGSGKVLRVRVVHDSRAERAQVLWALRRASTGHDLAHVPVVLQRHAR